MNQVILIGRLTRDPELKYLPNSGMAVTQFAIAVDREFTTKDGNKQTDFIDIQVWGKVAENCANYIGKGSLVGIQGSLRVDNYKNADGENRKAVKVNASKVQFLDNRNNKGKASGEFESSFSPDGLDPNGFEAINDPDLPF